MKAIKYCSEYIFGGQYTCTKTALANTILSHYQTKIIGAYSQDTVDNLSTVFNVFSLLFWPFIHQIN